MSLPSPSRPARKDAQHNRALILEAAARAFTSEGVDASMDAIAKDAGVGPGTLYRHFPSKDTLLAALLDRHYEKLKSEQAIIEAEEGNPAHLLERWIDALGDWMLVYDGLPEPLRAAWSNLHSPLTPTCRDMVETTEKFLKAAQRDGLARQELKGRDIFLAALAIAWASGASTADKSTRRALSDALKKGWASERENS